LAGALVSLPSLRLQFSLSSPTQLTILEFVVQLTMHRPQQFPTKANLDIFF
jgi:hypothetical protein